MPGTELYPAASGAGMRWHSGFRWGFWGSHWAGRPGKLPTGSISVVRPRGPARAFLFPPAE